MAALLACAAAAQVPRYGVFETALTADRDFENPFTEARVTAEFRSPDGRKFVTEGFYYGGAEWRVRFAPDRVGNWSYDARLTGKGVSARKSGTFQCTDSERRGFVRVSRRNPYRLEYDDGTPFYPIGVQTCGYFDAGMDGPGPDGKWKAVPAATWAKAFEGSVNLLRWQLGAGTKAGCALPLIPPGGPPDRYDTELARRMDELMALQKGHGFSHIMILFQDMSLWGDGETTFGKGHDLRGYKSLDAPNLPQQDAYIRYVVARWGAYVDIWELFNEDSYAPDSYLAHLAAVVRKADPYRHPVTTNYTRSTASWNEMVTWHAYMSIPANDVDHWVAAAAGRYKSYGKPVLNTEFGNKGMLSNLDPVKWRVAAWTAFLSETNMLYWGMSGTITKPNPRGNANAYLGPDTRQHLRVLNEFTRGLPIDLRPVDCSYSLQNDVRIYALANGKTAVVYVHHWADHAKPFEMKGGIYVHTGAGTFRATWIDPATGAVVKTVSAASTGEYTVVEMPPVTIDLACRMERQD